MAKLMNLVSRSKVNPLIGAAECIGSPDGGESSK